jgi:SpoVK/Ycf46/Vps4 family AAA+-type ATPase
MVFKGPAGTAKTTVARIVGKILAETGVLSSGHLIEVQRADLVGDTLEQSARRTVEAVKRAIGGVLFVDEAYTLTSTDAGRDSGKEIVDTLLKLMEDYREEFVVIVAGYPLEMEQFLNSNPGLRSRFVRVLDFPSYSPDELLDILAYQAAKRGYVLGDGVREALVPRLELVSKYPGFGNGRHVRNQLEAAIVRQATRVNAESSDDELRMLTVADFADPTAVSSVV